MLAVEENPRVHIGANNPPEPVPEVKPLTSFESHVLDIDSYWEEAGHWFDGAAIENAEQAEKVQSLKRLTELAHKAADASRIKENEPFDKGKAEVQARYAPLISDTKTIKGKTVKIIEACDTALTPWLRKVDEDQKAEAKRLRDIADAEAAVALAALTEARAENNITDLAQAEAAIVQARQAETVATRAAAAKPLVAGVGRAAGLKDNWETTLTDAQAALTHYKLTDPDWLRGVLLERACLDVRNNKRTIPGFTIVNNPVAR